jgi:iron(III) transport system substrate-binding protein
MVHRVYTALLAFALVAVLAACVPIAPSAPVEPSSPQRAPADLAAAESAPATAPAHGGRLVIYTGRSEPLLKPVVDAFRAANPSVEVLVKAGSNSELANALIEEKGNPQADCFITTELVTIQLLAARGVLDASRPAAATSLLAEFVGPDDNWVGLTRRARVIMYNTDLVPADEAPKSIFELTNPKWKGQVAAAGSTNGSMQAQIAAMRQLIGDDQTETWLRGLLANDVTFFGGHTDVRKAVGAGEFKLGLVNHYYYHLQAAEGSKVGVIYPDQGDGEIGLLTNATAAAVVKGGANAENARAFINFLVSIEGQRLFAWENYEYPLSSGVALREGVQPLDDFRLAEVDVAAAAAASDATFDLIERVGLP